jgi:hypothetical protein
MAAERARTLAEEGAASLQGTKNYPTAYSVGVSSRTGSIYMANSGRPLPQNIHPTLSNRMPNPSLETWRVANCAEFKVCNLALFAGENIEDLAIYTMDVDKFVPKVRCLNCQITTDGAYVPSDLLNP